MDVDSIVPCEGEMEVDNSIIYDEEVLVLRLDTFKLE